MAADPLLIRLRTSRQRLLTAISGLTEDGFRARPADDAWSVAEVLAHLILCDEEAAGTLAGSATAANGRAPTPARRAEEQAEEMARWRGAPAPQLVHGLLAARRALEQRLESLPPSAREPLSPYCRALADHELEHVAQVEAIRATITRAAGV